MTGNTGKRFFDVYLSSTYIIKDMWLVTCDVYDLCVHNHNHLARKSFPVIPLEIPKMTGGMILLVLICLGWDVWEKNRSLHWLGIEMTDGWNNEIVQKVLKYLLLFFSTLLSILRLKSTYLFSTTHTHLRYIHFQFW